MKIRILFLSNMLPEKGYMELFNAFKSLNKKYKNNAILEFAGKFYTPQFKKEFIELVRNENNIYYYGQVSDKKKISFEKCTYILFTNKIS